jgi:hypothetical protein
LREADARTLCPWVARNPFAATYCTTRKEGIRDLFPKPEPNALFLNHCAVMV